MTRTTPTVLSISYDESLLRTRELILNGAGFKVTSAFGFTEASEHCRNGFDLVIIGHSLPFRDKTALVEQIRAHNVSRILSLSRPGEAAIKGVDHSVDAWSPDVLIAAARSVLNQQDGRTHGAAGEP